MSKEDLIQNVIESMAQVQRPSMNNSWKELGLSHAQVSMLHLLYHHSGASVKQVAEYLGISKSAVSQLLEPLADKGYVSRRQDPHDRRVARLQLSAKGMSLLKKLAKYKFAGLRSALEALTEQELNSLRDIYKKMSES